ncbi:hypothetical protein CR513_35834, partial [Mucuna pruriens]
MWEKMLRHRENIFHSKFLILGNLFSMILDWGSCVKKLALPKFVHPRPCKLQCLSERGELLVGKEAKVTFTLSGYKDKVRVIHDEVTNRFTFVHLGKRMMLKHISQREMHKD